MNSGQGLGIEIIGTLQLVLCVLATTDRRRRDLGGSGPLAIGLSVALGHLLAVSRGPSQVGMGVERAGPGRGCRVPCHGQWKEPPTGVIRGGNQLFGAGELTLPRKRRHRDLLTIFWVRAPLSF